MENFVQLNKDFERWMRKHTSVVLADIRVKHKNMSVSTFMFLRATFFAWVKRYYATCPELISGVPVVPSIGDLHVENFGTWRDAEGRLCWGCNDFDEAFPLPYTNDLVRLATSAKFAVAENGLKLSTADACAAILDGYVEALQSGGQAFVLEERHPELRRMAVKKLKSPAQFWGKLAQQLSPCKTRDEEAIAVLKTHLPDPDIAFSVRQRTAGQGSLGRPRFVALVDFAGGKLAREVKKSLPSACVWAGLSKDERSFFNAAVAHSLRSADPVLSEESGWIVRRLSPDCSRIELTDLPRHRDEHLLLRAQGAEAANMHISAGGAAVAARILKDLRARESGWLHAAVKKMARVVKQDQRDWSDYYKAMERKKAR